jgi:hypothetical protein
MTNHQKKVHVDLKALEDAISASNAKRSKQFKADELTTAKLLQTKWMAVTNQSFNSMNASQRKALADWIEFIADLSRKSSNIKITDLFYGATTIRNTLPLWKDIIIRKVCEKMALPKTYVSATSDPWTSRHSPHTFIDLNFRIVDPSARTSTEMFQTKLLGVKTMKDGDKNSHTALHIERLTNTASQHSHVYVYF